MPWTLALVVAIGGSGLAAGPAAGTEGNDPVRDTPRIDGARNDSVAESGSATGPAGQTAASPATDQWGTGDYDPWEPFNERMFWFNHDVLDRFVLKPVAIAWDTVLPDTVQRHLDNAFDNLGMPVRLVNNLLQARPRGAGRELARFFLNSAIGIAGFFDVAKAIDIEKSGADTGQTLGVWGVGPGPYLVLPTLPPLTVRDAIGYGVDGLLDPLSYFLPFAANTGRWLGKTANERSLNLQVFQDVEDSVLDLYSAVRNGYLQRRRRAIEERRNQGQ